MHYILLRQTIGGRCSKWIAILQEFDLEFSIAKSNKSLVFVELMTHITWPHDDYVVPDLLLDE